ncbi:MAG: lipopolysaccharide biosynthesis protein [Geminicoccaceae bacterium]
MPSLDQAEYYSISRLRWNTLIFTGGKGINATLSLGIFALIASSLSKSDFAIYAWLIALVELSTSLSRVGIGWAVDRYVPQLRSTLNSLALRRFILIMTSLRLAVILVMAFAFFWAGEVFLTLSGHEDWIPAFDRYIVIIIPFALMTFLRDFVFQSLLQQAHSQGNTTVRHLIFLGALFASLLISGELTLNHVIFGEIAATFIAAAVAFLQLWHLLRQLPYDATPTSDSLPSWQTIARFAANSYANEVLRMSGSGYAVMAAAPHLLTTIAVAPYGFCQTLFTQLNRFLPAHLFSGLYRPRLVSEYTKTGSFDDLNRQLIIILKVSNYILAAAIAVFAVYGAELLTLLSGGKYADAHGLMLLFLFLMLVDNHRQVLVALCNTIEKVAYMSRASLFLPFVVPIAIGLVWAGLGASGLVLALIFAEVLCVGAIVCQLRTNGYRLQADLFGQARIVAAGLMTVAFGWLIQSYHPDGWFWNFAGMALTGVVFIAFAKILRPMSAQERSTIERMAGRRIHVL